MMAYDGEEALEMFYKESFVLLLLDVMMPKKMVFRYAGKFEKIPMFRLLW